MSGFRTRIAPSPTGENLHIGNAYTALINYIVAKKTGGKFIVRVEDTDQTRLVAGSEERILASLKWLGLTYDEGPDIGGPYSPYRQSERLPTYRKFAEELIAKRHAYYCFCTTERLEEMRKNQEANHQPPMYDGLCKNLSPQEAKKRVSRGEKYVVRLNVPDEGITTFHDIVRGDISFENILIDDQVLLKSDGFPTYHLGVVVDDHIMKITHIIRGEEWISSTPKHILLYDFFGWDKPIYAHMSVLRNPDKSKLSKRKNPVWVSWFRQQGYLPEAILNFLGTMAWTYPDEKELFSVEEMMKVFKLEDIQATAPIFNVEKLRWFNGEYLRVMKSETLKQKLCSFDSTLEPKNPMMDQIIPLIRERMKTFSEFQSLAGFFFVRPASYEKPLDKRIIDALYTELISTDWNHDVIEKNVRKVSEKLETKAKEVFMQLRLVITGKTVGPPLIESMIVLGKQDVLDRCHT